MKKIVRKIIAAAMATSIMATSVLLLSGCSQTYSTIPLKDALSELDNYSFGKYENINFDNCKIIKNDVNELYKLKVLREKNESNEKSKERAEKMYNSFNDGVEISYSKPATDAGSEIWVCMDDNYKRRVRMSFTGSGDVMNLVEINGEEVADSGFLKEDGSFSENVYKIYNIEEDITDVEYKVGGEMYKISDAVKYAEKYVDSIKELIFDERETAKISKVLVIKNNVYCDYAYRMIFRTYKNGLITDNNGVLGGFDENGVNGEYMAGNSFEMLIPKKDTILQMLSYAHESALYDKSTSVSKIIPLSTAEKILEKTLAPLEKYQVRECALEYCSRTRRNDEERYYEPMWVFVTNEIYGYSGWSSCRQPLNIYVNAVTGDCYIYKNGRIYEKGV